MTGNTKRPASESSKTNGGSSKYQKVSGREHILLRPDMYTGSTEFVLGTNTIINEDPNPSLESKDFATSEAFLQCTEEILMNAVDRISAVHEANSTIVERTKNIKIWVTSGSVEVLNDGDGIDTGIVEAYGIHAPELIFGHLRSSSNYEDSNKRLNSGRNGLGAKITNVFSKKFTVETVSGGFKYKQVFENNMSTIGKPKITKFSGKSYTRVKFEPDFERLNMKDGITDDVVGIVRRRAYEVSVTSYDPVKVFFNDTLIKVNTVDKYMELYVPSSDARFSVKVSDRWRISVGFTPENDKFRAVSFCNSTATLENGKHVDYVVDPLVKRLVEHYRKKFKAPKISPKFVKDSLTVFVSAFLENPLYNSQSKNFVSSPPAKFGSTCVVPDSIFNKLVKSGLTEHVEDFAKNRDSRVLDASNGKKTSKIRGIPKLHDAAKAGTKNSEKCFLFLCEGDSALTMLLSGLTSKDRETCGMYPLRGKLLNVRDAANSQIAGNAEITNLKKILGLQNGKVYESTKELRYGGIVIVTDQDLDGGHIKALLLNVFDVLWPGLITSGFVRNMTTPIVRATGPRKAVKLFYNQFDYDAWKDTVNLSSWKIKYLKGLGSSTSSDAKEYFRDFSSALVKYTRDEESVDSMKLAFSKDRANDRKEWLQSYDPSDIIDNSQKEVSVSELVHKELKHFSEADVRRSIPSAIDGLKVSQRKILFGCFKKGILTNEIKTAQIVGYIGEHSRYHHGEASLSGAVTSMAQDFVGSNNINLLLPEGQLGSRLQGGKDAASSRYTFIKMSPLTPLIYRPEDNPILSYTEDDGHQTEATYYVPIIPMSLVNSMEGIGTGFSTSVPCFDPRDLIGNIRNRLDSKTPKELTPWVRGFKGAIDPVESNFKTSGIYEIHGSTVRITELPVGTWTSNYKAYLETLLEKKLVSSYSEKSTDVVVDFNVDFQSSEEVSKLESSGALKTLLKLTCTLRTSNMHLYGSTNNIRKFDKVSEIEDEHFVTRLKAYSLRKAHVLKVLEFETKLLEAKARFIKCKISGEIVLDSRKYEDVMDTLKSMGFPELGKSFDDSELSFGYITSINLFDLTSERVSKLMQQVADKVSELDLVRKTTPEEMWIHELDVLEKAL